MLLNDLIKVSGVSKDFYLLSRTSSFYVKKLNESKKIFRDRSWIVSNFLYLCDTFYFKMFRKWTTYVDVNDILKVKKIIRKKLYYLIFLFHVRDHIFLCVRSQYESNMCLFCTKLYLRNKVSRLIEKKLTVDVLDYFPVQLPYGLKLAVMLICLFILLLMIDRNCLMNILILDLYVSRS